MLVLCCTVACVPGSTQAAATATHSLVTETAAAAPPDTPSGTATSTASAPSATQTLPPAPRVFTETFDGPVPYWTFRQAGNGQAVAAPAIRDGFLVFDLLAPNQWVYALYGGPDYGDVTVEARVQSRTGGDEAAGIVCRYDRNAGWYELNVFADGTYQLLFGQWLADGVARYVPLYRGEADAIQGDENTVGLECQGDTLTPFINGGQLRKWEEAKFGLRRGKVGLSVSAFAGVPLTVAFDSVKVSEP